jgi:esterase/lipase superfamily enzyme
VGPGEVKWPGAPPGNPATGFVVTKASLLEAKATRSWLDSHGSAAPKDQALVFVHGYNNRFRRRRFSLRSSCTLQTRA